MVRVRYRYLLCAIERSSPSPPLSPSALLRLLRASIEHNFGDVGAGTAQPGLSVKFCCPHLGLALVRAHRQVYRLVWSAATAITAVNGDAARISVVHVGATIRQCQRSAVQFGEAAVRDAHEAERARIRAAAEAADVQFGAMAETV